MHGTWCVVVVSVRRKRPQACQLGGPKGGWCGGAMMKVGAVVVIVVVVVAAVIVVVSGDGGRGRDRGSIAPGM